MMNNNQNPADLQQNPADAQGNVNQVNPTNPVNAGNAGIQNNPYINNMNTPIANNTGMQNNPYINQNANNMNNQMPVDAQNNDSFVNGDFVKGALIGAGIAFLLTNKTTQKAIFNGFSKGSELVQAGIEELKERMEDAKAQMETKEF